MQAGDGLEMYHTLIHCFEGSIMHTYMSRFSQFLIFYICSLDPSRFARNFMEHLIHLVTSFDQVRKQQQERTPPPPANLFPPPPLSHRIAKVAKMRCVDRTILQGVSQLATWLLLWRAQSFCLPVL